MRIGCRIDAVAIVASLLAAGTMAAVMAQGSAPGGEAVVVDNGGPGFAAEGKWNGSTRDKGFEGTNYLWHAKGAGEAKAVFTANLPAEGEYEVFVKWVASKRTDRASNAPFTVASADGVKTVRVDMSDLSKAGRWISVGVFKFHAGVAVVALTNDADNSVVADAVRFAPAGTSVQK